MWLLKVKVGATVSIVNSGTEKDMKARAEEMNRRFFSTNYYAEKATGQGKAERVRRSKRRMDK